MTIFVFSRSFFRIFGAQPARGEGFCSFFFRIFSYSLSIVSGYFLLLPRKAKITLRGENNLRNVHFLLVLKGIFGGSLKITLQNKNNPEGKK